MKKILIPLSYLILTLLFINGCKNVSTSGKAYLKDKNISGISGIPNDSSVFFLPASMEFSDSYIKNCMPQNVIDSMSALLYLFKEPVLFNKYLGRDVYRFVWLYSKPVVIILQNDKSSILISMKILDEIKPQKIISKTKILSINEWNEFKSRIDSADYYNLYPWMDDGIGYGYGREIVLESHFRSQYWIIFRKDHDYDLSRCIEYLIELSELKRFIKL